MAELGNKAEVNDKALMALDKPPWKHLENPRKFSVRLYYIVIHMDANLSQVAFDVASSTCGLFLFLYF